jgi:hypothetical protein
MESIKNYVANLPKAVIAPRPKRKPQHLRQTASAPAPPAKVAPPRRRPPQRTRLEVDSVA